MSEWGVKGEEIRRVEDWRSGDVTCDRCGDTLHLWFNGGELDSRVCSCGRTWRTEHVQIDLVVHAAPGEDGTPRADA